MNGKCKDSGLVHEANINTEDIQGDRNKKLLCPNRKDKHAKWKRYKIHLKVRIKSGHNHSWDLRKTP